MKKLITLSMVLVMAGFVMAQEPNLPVEPNEPNEAAIIGEENRDAAAAGAAAAEQEQQYGVDEGPYEYRSYDVNKPAIEESNEAAIIGQENRSAAEHDTALQKQEQQYDTNSGMYGAKDVNTPEPANDTNAAAAGGMYGAKEGGQKDKCPMMSAEMKEKKMAKFREGIDELKRVRATALEENAQRTVAELDKMIQKSETKMEKAMQKMERGARDAGQ